MSASAEVEKLIDNKDIKGAFEQYKRELDQNKQERTRYMSQAEMYIASINKKLSTYNATYDSISDEVKALINYKGEYKPLTLENFEAETEKILQLNKDYNNKIENVMINMLRGAYQ